MTTLTIEPEEVSASTVRRIWASDVGRRFRRNKLGMASVAWLLFVVVASFVLPYFYNVDPNFANPVLKLRPPSAEHLFGTDDLGRDLLARVLAGGRVSMTVAVAGTIMAMSFGVILGTTAGYAGGWVDEFLSRVFDILISIPTLLLGILIVVAFGGSLPTVVLAVAIGTIPLYGRLFRAGTMTMIPREFVQGAISLGLPSGHIAARHVLPNTIIPVVVIAAGNMGHMALSEASLSFLGAGIQPPAASWGNIMSAGQPYLQYAPWVAIIPGTVLTLVSLAFSFIGDALRDAYDIRESAVAD